MKARVKNIICIRCPRGCKVAIKSKNNKIQSITGNACPLGIEYAREEFIDPKRILPTTVKVINGELPLVPVKTEKGIPKDLLFEAMKEIAELEVKAPVKIGQVIIKNLIGTGVRLIATRNINRSN